MKKTKQTKLLLGKAIQTTLIAITVITTFVSARAGVPIGQSALIDTLDYSDSFTVNTTSRPGIFHYTNPDAVDPYYNVESGSPTVQWRPTANFSFNTDANPVSQYPGNTGNPGAATGMAQTGGRNFNFAYGKRDLFVVQADATFVTTDNIQLGTFANVGDQTGAAGSLVAKFYRGSIVLASSAATTATGFTTGVDAGDTSWHNYAVVFNKNADTISFFVDEVLKGTLDLTSFAGGAHASYSSNAVGGGGKQSGYVAWFDNFQVGAPKEYIVSTLIDKHRKEVMDVTTDRTLTTLVSPGKIVKTGSGSLSVTNLHLIYGQMDVNEGTVEIGSGTADLPLSLRSGLAFWVDANRNVETDGDTVTCWKDVRDGSEDATYPAARQFISTNGIPDAVPTLVTGGDDVSGLNLIDFDAYGSGKWLQWQDAESNRLSIADIRTVFMVVSCTNGTGFLLGDWDNTSTNINEGTGDFHVGGATATGYPVGEALKNAPWWHPGALANVVNGQTFVNGEFVDGTTENVSLTGELMSLATTGNAQASNFGNNRNYKVSQGISGVDIDRQGGGRIGEVLIYTSALTESQRCQVESYLMKKWFGYGLGTLRIAEGAELTLQADAANKLSNADITGIGTLNLQGNGILDLSEMDNPVLPPTELAIGSGISSGTLRQHTGQPFVLDGGSIYTVSNGVSSRSSLADGTQIEKQGDGVLTASSIADGVARISVHSGTLRLAPALPDMSRELTNALDNAGFETYTSIGTGGTSDWGYTPTGTGWTITEDLSSADGADWSGVGLARAAPGTPWCQAQTAPDGEWCAFIKRAGELERTFTVPDDGRYEISFFTAARPGRTHHLYQVLIDTTNIIASIRTVRTGFSKATCVTPYISAGTHTLCFKGFYDTSDRASVIDAIVITKRDTTDYVSIPSSDFEECLLPAVTIAENDHYFEYNPTLAGWNFTPDPAITNSGVSNGHSPWFYSDMGSGGQGAFIRQTGGMATSITFPTSGVYSLSFKAAGRAGYWGDHYDWYNKHDFTVSLGSNTVAKITTFEPEFETYTYTLPVINDGESLTRTLQFSGINSFGGDRTSIVDDIRIQRMPDIANPGFETSADLLYGTWEPGIENAGWEFDVGVDFRGQSGIAQSGSEWGNTSPEGDCNAFLQTTARMAQTLTFDADGTYELSFLAAGRSQQSRYLNHDFQISFSSMKVGYVQTVDGTFRRYSFRLPNVKAGTPYELAFEGINQGDATDRTSFIDSVILTKIEDPELDSTAFPETELALSSGTTLELDYDGMLTMERVTYNGRSYAGVMTEENTPFIKGTGSLYATPQGTIILLK